MSVEQGCVDMSASGIDQWVRTYNQYRPDQDTNTAAEKDLLAFVDFMRREAGEGGDTLPDGTLGWWIVSPSRDQRESSGDEGISIDAEGRLVKWSKDRRRIGVTEWAPPEACAALLLRLGLTSEWIDERPLPESRGAEGHAPIEYLVVNVHHRGVVIDGEWAGLSPQDFLFRAGSEGWRLVSAGQSSYIFERPLLD